MIVIISLLFASHAATYAQTAQTIDPIGNITLTYGDAPYPVNPKASSNLAVSLATSDANVVSINSDNMLEIKGTGDATITASQGGGGNDPDGNPYDEAPNVTFKVKVNKKNLTVRANDMTKYYDSQPFSGGNGVSYSGFAYSEGPNVLSGSLTFGGSSQGAIDPGHYDIILYGGLTANNYNITYVPGTLTIIEPNSGTANRLVFPGPYTIFVSSGLTLADIELPRGFVWKFPDTQLFLGTGQTFPAIYMYSNGRYGQVEGIIVVNVVTQVIYPGLQREVNLPKPPADVLVSPHYGNHYILIGTDFTFTLTFLNGEPFTVRTNRTDPDTGKQETLVGTPNDKGGFSYTIRGIVTQPVRIYYGDDMPNVPVWNDVIGKSAVWTHGQTLYIRSVGPDAADIFSITGRLIKRIYVTEGLVSETLPKGVYIVRLKDGAAFKVVSR